MTPNDPPVAERETPSLHLDEAAVRGELTRTFDICRDCRRCLDRCAVFPTLFDLIGATSTGEAGMLTPADQDLVVDACHGCGACRHGCPYAPGVHDAAVDVPSLVLRAVAMRRAAGQQSGADRRAAAILGSSLRTLVLGRGCSGPLRRLVAVVSGLRAGRGVAAGGPTASSRSRGDRLSGGDAVDVVVLPTCLVESQRPRIGHDLVGLADGAGTRCGIADTGCCGAPSLHAGDLRRFRRAARRMVVALDGHAASGGVIVVPEATCAEVIRRRYPEVLSGAAVDRVTTAVVGAVEFLSGLGGGVGPVGPDRAIRDRVLHLAGPDGPDGREARAVVAVLESLGCAVTVSELGTGVSGPWGLRSRNDANAVDAWDRVAAAAVALGASVITSGDVVLRPDDDVDGPEVLHPVEMIARALGDVAG
jgi:Fe-S oxidoreductase